MARPGQSRGCVKKTRSFINQKWEKIAGAAEQLARILIHNYSKVGKYAQKMP
jgi:hypothetical protein